MDIRKIRRDTGKLRKRGGCPVDPNDAFGPGKDSLDDEKPVFEVDTRLGKKTFRLGGIDLEFPANERLLFARANPFAIGARS